MRNKWRDLKKETMSAAQRKAARKVTDRYLAEIEIRDLRAEMKVTQTELAAKLQKAQTAVSQLESRSDWHLSTLRECVKALGGFFFSSRRRHTRCSRDWSSDVCSSD